MLTILDPAHGAVLNRHSARETAGGAVVRVSGISDGRAPVLVNGVRAGREGRGFTAAVTIAGPTAEIRAEAVGPAGSVSHSVRVLFDRESFRRSGFFIDDNIFFLEDIVAGGYASLFDCFYLEKLRGVHRRHGTKFVLNLFFHNTKNDFDLTRVPDRYRGEWADNADWLRLAFHAMTEFPDRPYRKATPEGLLRDYDRVRDEVLRFAGEAAWNPPDILHWVTAPPAALRALRERGTRLLGGFFRGEAGDTGFTHAYDGGYSLDPDRSDLVVERGLVHDFETDITFCRVDAVCNSLPQERIREKLERRAAEAGGSDVLCLMTHEQHSFPHYRGYIPDHFERIELAARLAAEHGYRPVFLQDGFAGNPQRS